MWFGVIQILIGVYGLVTGQFDSAQSTTLIVTGAGTLGFRAVTSTPVSVVGS